MSVEVEFDPIDTSQVDQWIGKKIGGLQLRDPVAINDIRRWTQAMQNPNPLYYDAAFAANSRFGKLVGSQSFIVACSISHGLRPATQGVLPGCHHMFAGDEWSFPGPRVEVGDTVTSERVAFDYRVTQTSFAGPTVIQRGDTTYRNQRDEVIAHQRLTAVRYRVSNAEKVVKRRPPRDEPAWTDDEIAAIEEERLDYARAFQRHILRSHDTVEVGEGLGRRVIGPHSLLTFATEWRAFLFTIWGATSADGLPTSGMDIGLLPEMSYRTETDIDPGFADGLYYGSARGHGDHRYARLIGMPAPFGYGACMGANLLDYVGNWAGESGHIEHSALRYRNPVFVGDVTYLNGVVTEVGRDGTAAVAVEMTNQDGLVLADGPITVRLEQP